MRQFAFLITLSFAGFFLRAQEQSPGSDPSRFDLKKDPVLYTVGYSHLDTEWRWDYTETINKFLKATLDDNFDRFKTYKPYVFTFTGARRYRMMKEYYPEKYEQLKRYVAEGRWFVGGSSVDECDVNIPSPESILRQILYGNKYFRQEFGKESVDFMLPDCFGFPSYLPSVLAHAGILGFSTQKLSWGSAKGIPFNIGWWNGPDGKGVVAALNATDYTGRIQKGLDTSTYWANRIRNNGLDYGLFADYRYYGVGDQGGAPREDDIRNAIEAMNNPARKFHVYLTSSDRFFRDLTPELTGKLPSYTGDLLLTEHSAGSLTSQSAMKRWNRKNEQLAQAAEAMSVISDWLGGVKYPSGRVNEAWWLLLGSQMHDILPGTSIPGAYNFAWNDEVLAMNQFGAALEDAVGTVIRAMDTRVNGKCVVVVNPLAVSRNEIVEATVQFPEGAPAYIRVFDPLGKEVPHQVLATGKNSIRLLFSVAAVSFGLDCYEVRSADQPPRYKSDLTASGNTMENGFLKVTLNANGDISGIMSKTAGKEILREPAGLVLLREHPEYWPAWNMDWKDRHNPAKLHVKGPARITMTENGPLRVTYRIERKTGNTEIVQLVQLASGQESVMVHSTVLWQTTGYSLKADFPLTASSPAATYNTGFGTIVRGNNHERMYEVPSREWFDLTDKSGSYGVTILEDSRFGSDKPADNQLRLTLLYTPRTNFYHDQSTQDWGVHTFTYGIYPHKGDWRSAGSEWKARSLNQPLRVFQAGSHAGMLGKSFSFCSLNTPQVDVRAMKKAENGSGIIIRLQELIGEAASDCRLTFPVKISSVWEADGQERRTVPLQSSGKTLGVVMQPFEIKTLLVVLDSSDERLTPVFSYELPLPYNADVVSSARNKKDGSMGEGGWCYPAELFPDRITAGDVTFKMGRRNDGSKNAVVCEGQKILLPKTGNFNKVYILASALSDTVATFRTGAGKSVLQVGKFGGFIGQADNRLWDDLGRIRGVEKAYIRRAEVAWFATHMHRDTLTMPYSYGYIFLLSLDAGPGSGYLQLPDNPSIHIFAISVASNPYDHVAAAAPLYDDPSVLPALSPVLPVSYTKSGDPQTVKTSTTRKRHFTELPARVSMQDYADLHQPNGVVARFYHNTPDTMFRALENGMVLNLINDGMFVLMGRDSVYDLWTTEGEGRILIDLQKEVTIDSLFLFVSATVLRGPQSFSVWSMKATGTPHPGGDPAATGWRYLGYAPPADIWGNSSLLYTIRPADGKPLKQRYIMLVSEPSGAGFGPCYFREIDIFEAQQ